MNVPSNRGEKGSVFVLVGVTIAIVVAMAALALGTCRTYDGQRQIQFVADAASLAGAQVLLNIGINTGIYGYSDFAATEAKAKQIANVNGVTNPEIDSAGGVQMGVWDPATNTFTANAANPNAVRVRIKRAVNMPLGRIFGVSKMEPDVVSISTVPRPVYNCIKPFGIEGITLQSVAVGQTFPVGNGAPGNWGKIDINGGGANGMSNPNNFLDAMLGVSCTAAPPVGTSLGMGTGYAGIKSVFDTLLNLGQAQMYVLVTSTFPNGNSGTITVQQYAQVTYLSSTGNGSGWQGLFRLDAFGAVPPPGSVVAGTRRLAY